MNSDCRPRGFRFHEASPTLYVELFAVVMIAVACARLALAYQAAATSGLAANHNNSGGFITTGNATALSQGDGGLGGSFNHTSSWENADTVYFPAPPNRPDI